MTGDEVGSGNKEDRAQCLQRTSWRALSDAEVVSATRSSSTHAVGRGASGSMHLYNRLDNVYLNRFIVKYKVLLYYNRNLTILCMHVWFTSVLSPILHLLVQRQASARLIIFVTFLFWVVFYSASPFLMLPLLLISVLIRDITFVPVQGPLVLGLWMTSRDHHLTAQTSIVCCSSCFGFSARE